MFRGRDRLVIIYISTHILLPLITKITKKKRSTHCSDVQGQVTMQVKLPN